MNNMLNMEEYLNILAQEYHLTLDAIKQNLCKVIDELVTKEINYGTIKTVYENDQIVTMCEHDNNTYEIEYNKLPHSVVSNIMPKLKYILKNIHFNTVQHKFQNQINCLFIGTVTNIGDSVILEVEGARGLLPKNEQIPQENYQVGDEVACYLKDINNRSNERLIFSRRGDIFISLLLSYVVPAIQDGSIQIVKIARWNGVVTKVVVDGNSHVRNCIGECLGEHNVYYNELVKHLQLEKIRFIQYKENIYEYIAECLGYIDYIQDIILNEDSKVVYVIIYPEKPKGPIIGKNSVNIRLAMKLQNPDKVSKINILYPDEYQEILASEPSADITKHDTQTTEQ